MPPKTSASSAPTSLPSPPHPSSVRAKKYGIIDVPSLKHTGISGLTPIDRPSVGDLRKLSDQETKDRAQIVRFQRVQLGSFATWELNDQQCLEKEDAKPNNLSHTLHPLVERKRWARDATAGTVGEGIPGLWDPRDDQVWITLVPILAIVTRILTNVHFGLWFDALCFGERKKLPEDACDAGGQPRTTLYSFHLRKPEEAAVAKKYVDKIIKKMVGKLKFTISSTVNLSDPVQRSQSHRHAFHVPKPPGKDGKYVGAWIVLNTKDLSTFMNTEMTISEKLVQQFAIAKTLCHEIAHAVGYYVTTLNPDLDPATHYMNGEPFFEDEAINECGWSSEVALWGGSINSLLGGDYKTRENTPLMCLASHNWPNWHRHWSGGESKRPRDRRRFPERYGKGARADSWPIQTAFVENLQQEEYWDTQVKTFGGKALRPKRIFGHSYVQGDPGNPETNHKLVLIGPDCQEWIDSGNPLQAVVIYSDANLVLDRSEYMAEENWNISKKIRKALFRQRKKKEREAAQSSAQSPGNQAPHS